MRFHIKFYARTRDEVIGRFVEAPDRESLVYAVEPYGSSEEDILDIIEEDDVGGALTSYLADWVANMEDEK